MGQAPVRKLTVVLPAPRGPQTVDLPAWETLPPSIQTEFDRLDRDDNGVLVYAPTMGAGDTYATADGASVAVDIRHADDSPDRLMRGLWAYEGDNPFNDRRLDLESAGEREELARQFHGNLQAGLPALPDDPSSPAWETRLRVHLTAADPKHLYEDGKEAQRIAEEKNDARFSRWAERFLLEARRLAAGPRWARREFLGLIDRELEGINKDLDREEQRAFGELKKKPYLMAAMGAPARAFPTSLYAGETEVVIRVSVPRGYPRDQVVSFLNSEQTIALRRSRFRGDDSAEEHRLEVTELVQDPNDPRITSRILEGRVSELVFDGQRDYYHVALKVPAAAVAAIPAGIQAGNFDLVIRENGREGGGEVRSVRGAVVLGPIKRIAFAADTHVTERDYEIKEVLFQQLQEAAKREGKGLAVDAERVERFYESFNERVEVLISLWNEAYRGGRLDGVGLAGDLVDFINIATTLAAQGYRGTNVRRLVHLLSKLEAPLMMKPGNHDPHIQPYAHGDHKQRFTDDEEMYKHYHLYDGLRFPPVITSKIWSIVGLLTRRCGVSGSDPTKSSDFPIAECLPQIVSRLTADDPFGSPSDEGMGPYMREAEAHDADLTPLDDTTYLYHWRTNEEHFNYRKWQFEEAHDPVLMALLSGMRTYLFDQHVNGIGPRPETFVHFLRSVEQVRERRGHLVLAEHYPAFYEGVGPDQTPESEDSLKGDANWALRLATWYYKNGDGSPTVDVVVSGHVHKWGEFDFRFDFDNPPAEEGLGEAELRGELAAIFSRKDPGEIFEQIDIIRHKYRLDDRIVTQRIVGNEGILPGRIVRDFNAGRGKKTLFINLPAAGASAIPGYVMMEIHPGGRKTIKPHFVDLAPDGRVTDVTGEQLPALQRERELRAARWKASLGLKVELPTEPLPTAPRTAEISRVFQPGLLKRFDLFPFLDQYPRGKFDLAAGLGWQVWPQESGRRALDWTLHTTVPLAYNYSSPLDWRTLDEPRYLRLGAKFDGAVPDYLFAGVGLGAVEPRLTVGVDDFATERQRLGLQALIMPNSAMLIPAPYVGFDCRVGEGDCRFLAGARWYWSVATYRHSHSH